MKTVGIICEYNPFHLGHQHQFHMIRQKYGNESAIVCLMSGYYVQRGAPAIFDKCIRAKAAVLSGADLVLELPIGACLSSAEGFADGGVQILGRICDILSFGTESMNAADLFSTASVLLSDEFSVKIKEVLITGCSFPAARQRVLEAILVDRPLPVSPNDILAVEYCKAILSRKLSIDIFPVGRNNNYHSAEMNCLYPSATALRKSIQSGRLWQNAVPEESTELYANASVHTLRNAENAILYRLRTMTDTEFEALPFGSEGLWRRFMHAAQTASCLDEIISLTKTKRYTQTRINRMILCAFLGINNQLLHTESPYVRVLAFNNKGRSILKQKSGSVNFQNIGEKSSESYWNLEQKCSDLYGLFADQPEPPGRETIQRVFYNRGAGI